MAERKAITKQMGKAVRQGLQDEKGRMLDELCAPTGWTRRRARRSLHQALNLEAGVDAG